MSKDKSHFFYRIFQIVLVLALLAGAAGMAVTPVAADTGAHLSILGVSKGASVAIKAEGFPANTEFRVLMDKIGTKGVDGIASGTATTDKNGVFSKTFSIPRELQTSSRIAIRIEATNGTGWYAYNWFDNTTYGSTGTPSQTGGQSSGQSSGAVRPGQTTTGGAVLSIVEVKEDVSVEIEARRLPANASFNVFLEWKNRQGVVTSVRAGSLYSNGQGVIAETIAIPRSLRDRPVLVIWLVATNSSRIAVSNWFVNVSSDAGIGAGSPNGFENGVPYIEVLSVIKNDEVTIAVRNLPKKTTFVVLMGRMGTEGVDGTDVGEFKTDSKGQYTGTFDIPNRLKDRDDIAIRIEAVDNSGYYAFNWFENETSNG